MNRMATSSQPRAIVIGGSLSGLLTALLLRHTGWQVDVYERVSGDLAGRGAGIVTHPPLWRALETVGIDWHDNLGVAIEKRRLFAVDGRLLAETACPQTLTAWDRLYALLRERLPDHCYHRGKELVGLPATAGAVTARFRDGSHASADLLIACDGLRSTVRALLLPDMRPLYAGYVAWRGLVPEEAFTRDLYDALFMYLAFCLPAGEQMLGYPVAGPSNDLRRGHRRYNLVWYRPADESALGQLLTEDSGVMHEISIPPPAVSTAAIAEMREQAECVLAPQFRACWSAAGRPFVQPIYDVQSPRLVFDRVVLLGDAAFVARPHCGIGVTKAADDASTLVAALGSADAIDEALLSYESNRLGFGARVIAQARRLGYDLAAAATRHSGEPAAPTLSPEIVMRETATIDFLSRQQ